MTRRAVAWAKARNARREAEVRAAIDAGWGPTLHLCARRMVKPSAVVIGATVIVLAVLW